MDGQHLTTARVGEQLQNSIEKHRRGSHDNHPEAIHIDRLHVRSHHALPCRSYNVQDLEELSIHTVIVTVV